MSERNLHIANSTNKKQSLSATQQSGNSASEYDENPWTTTKAVVTAAGGAPIEPKQLTPKQIMHLQRTIGNKAVTRILNPTIQRGQKHGGEKKKKGKKKTTESAAPTFDDLPPDTIAISESQKLYIVVHGGYEGLVRNGQDLQVFNFEGTKLGEIYLSGTMEEDDYVSYLMIINEVEQLKGASYIVTWYLCKHTPKEYFEVHSVNNDDLWRRLEACGLKMVRIDDLRGKSSTAYEEALKVLESYNWLLKDED